MGVFRRGQQSFGGIVKKISAPNKKKAVKPVTKIAYNPEYFYLISKG
jgi:hypothetical protein